MKPSVLQKLDHLLDRYEELSALLSDAETINNQDRFRALSKEFSEIEAIVYCYRDYCKVQEDIDTAQSMLAESDADMRAMAEDELQSGRARLEPLAAQLQTLLLPRDPND